MKTELQELKISMMMIEEQLLKREKEINPEDLIKDEEVILTFTNKGYVKRMELSKYKAQKEVEEE